MQGLLSVVFWGFASGSDGRLRIPRAISRSKQILFGRSNAKNQDVSEILDLLKVVRERLLQNKIDQALLTAMKVKFLGMAFASKLVAFMDPEKAAVYDEVISFRLKGSPERKFREQFYVNPKNGSSSLMQAEVYSRWCIWCQDKATELNDMQDKWIDWNNQPQSWRCIDLERAFFCARAFVIQAITIEAES